jgi:hypothetical protein
MSVHSSSSDNEAVLTSQLSCRTLSVCRPRCSRRSRARKDGSPSRARLEKLKDEHECRHVLEKPHRAQVGHRSRLVASVDAPARQSPCKFIAYQRPCPHLFSVNGSEGRESHRTVGGKRASVRVRDRRDTHCAERVCDAATAFSPRPVSR